MYSLSKRNRRGVVMYIVPRVAVGQTWGGRHLRVIYKRDPSPDSVFIITAYDLTGKPLAAYRRRMRRRSR